MVFKIITKVLANRFKSAVEYLIQPQQCSFVAGRQGSDNIVIAQEVIHTMRTKGFVTLKVDMEKAYDRLDWDFLRTTLNTLELKEELTNLIMACTSSATMRVIWNGMEPEPFASSRGVRQGDPLSPYLFILCMERLGQLITEEVATGRWKGFKFNKNSPVISHQFFVDDLLLFGEATTE